ncbi:hypothetical protein [Microbacterium lacticum]
MARANRSALEAELKEIDAAIADHPYNAPEVVASREIIEQFEGEGNERVEQELAARGLPGLADNGRIVATGLASYSRLHRRRKKVLNKLERLSN